jgi:epoxyqueuosine reductase
MHTEISGKTDWAMLAATIKAWGRELGFADIGIAHVDLSHAEAGLLDWLAAGYHGEMDYMARHGLARARPAELVPGTVSVIIARLDYRPDAADAGANLQDPGRAYLSRYALGRDYHKVLRNKLQSLADRINTEVGTELDPSQPFQYRAFTDSAPVMEVELAAMSGLGWRGKHTLLLNRSAGSWFFLGELFTNLPLPADAPTSNHCGTCQACLDVCPTQAFVGPHVLDARRCISYLTIELKGSIPLELRPLIGNRVYGCDDCQLACPWNRFAPLTAEDDFKVRNGLDQATLVELFAWTEEEFNQRLAGSAIRRIGHERWLRNLAVGLGNIPADHPSATMAREALQARLDHESTLVCEHVQWALQRLAV